MTVGLRDRMAEKLPKLEIVATSGLVEQLRQVKDKEEIAEIRQAVWYAEQAFAVIRATLAAGADREGAGRRAGPPDAAVRGRGASFPPIVAVGPRAALPHATPDRQTIGRARLRAGRLGGRRAALQERLDAGPGDR